MTLYPVALDLRGRPVVVVGGGAPAERRAEALLAAGARVKVVAAELTDALAARAAKGEVEHLARPYRPGDLAGAFLVVAERGAPAVNEAVWREAEERGVPVNVEDDPPHCSFYAPAVVRRGDLTVAISTGGKAPALAVRLRQELERRLGAHYGRFLELVGPLRPRLLERHPDFARRRELWYRLVDSDVLDLLHRGEEEPARRRIAELVELEPEAAR